jgi:hypothetical protein
MDIPVDRTLGSGFWRGRGMKKYSLSKTRKLEPRERERERERERWVGMWSFFFVEIEARLSGSSRWGGWEISRRNVGGG